MAKKIRIKRGLKKDLPMLDIGELGFCVDTGEVFVGSHTGNLLVNGGGSGGGSNVSDSNINGNIKVNGNDLIVYDDTEIKNIISNKIDADALSDLVTVEDFNQTIENKVDKSELTGLATKTELQGKADKAELQNKADKSELSGLINQTTLNSELGKKAEKTHGHNLSEINDLDMTDKTGGNALQYDSTQGKIVLKPLPPSQGGASKLSALTDVDLSTSLPQEGHVLGYKDGQWKSVEVTGGSNLEFEDMRGGEVLILRPDPVKNIKMVDKSDTKIQIKWDKGDADVVSYNVYENNTFYSNVTTEYVEIIGLSPSNTYALSVASVNGRGEESYRSSVQYKTWGVNKLSVPKGTSLSYIDFPKSKFSAIGFVGAFNTTVNTWTNTILAPLGYDSLPYKVAHEYDGVRLICHEVSKSNYKGTINGVKIVHHSLIENNVEKDYIFQVDKPKEVNDEVRLFGDKDGKSDVGAVLRCLKIYKINHLDKLELVGYYDFTNQNTGTTVIDELGSFEPIKITGCTFI